MANTLTWAVITPSYNLDFRRCQLLCRSMDTFLTGRWHHYIIVDPPDYAMFKPLSGPRRTVLVKDGILPQGLRYVGKVPFMRLGRFWFSLKHGPVFGWQMQQFIKLAMAEKLSEDAMLFCDSDTLFLRPFSVAQFTRNGKVRFCRGENPQGASDPNIIASIRILGLDPKAVTSFWGHDLFVTWHRKSAVAMLAHIAKVHAKSWHEAIGYRIKLAEYHLYSTYIEYIADDPRKHTYVDNRIFAPGIWTKEQAKAEDLQDFCRRMRKPAVAVCVQSLIGMDLAPIAKELDFAIKKHATN